MTDVIRRPRQARRRAVLLLCLVAVITATTGCSRELGARAHSLINGERAAAGLPGLAWDDNAAAKAQAWAEQLAASRTLRHSRLTDGIEGQWNALGENVGFARSIDENHSGFMASPKHRGAILSREYTAVGVGVAQSGGVLYVVEVFRG